MAQNPTVTLLAHQTGSEKNHEVIFYFMNIGLYMYFVRLNHIHLLYKKMNLSVGKKYLTAVKRTVQKYIMLTINSNSSLYLKGISNRMED